MLKARILGTGSYLPDKILSNSDLEKLVDTSDEWIVSRTGIRERRIAAETEFPSTMGAHAAIRALQAAGVDATSVDLILVATMTPDYASPSTAGLIQAHIGATQAAAMDLQAACTGCLYGLSVAKAYIESGMARTVLLVASEKMSAVIDYTDRNTCVLFGDGAAAMVIAARGSGLTLDHVCLGADGSLSDLVIIPGGGSRHPTTSGTLAARLHYFKMAGRETYKHAVRRMLSSTHECLKATGVKEEQIRWLIPHQANARIIEAFAKSIDIPEERVYLTLQKYGNTSAAGVAITLDEVLHTQSAQPGDHFLLVAFGGGLTWGAALLTQQSHSEES